MKIIEYSDEMRAQWDHYVLHHPQGTLFHLTAWQRVIARSFGYKPLYLVAVEGMDIRGVLPLFMVSNPLMGRTLISTPFAVYGGGLGADKAGDWEHGNARFPHEHLTQGRKLRD